MIRWDDHPSAQGNLKTIENDAKFVHSLDIIWPEKKYSLFGTTHNDLGHLTDIYQGEIGNCWFMHGASIVGLKPGRLEKVFYNTELSSNGIYALRMYVLGVPTTITIDDHLPLSENGTSVFAGVSPDGAVWGPIIEKAFAKVNGSYESIISGDPQHSIEVLTGAPTSRY